MKIQGRYPNFKTAKKRGQFQSGRHWKKGIRMFKLLRLLSCESSVTVKEKTDRKNLAEENFISFKEPHICYLNMKVYREYINSFIYFFFEMS